MFIHWNRIKEYSERKIIDTYQKLNEFELMINLCWNVNRDEEKEPIIVNEEISDDFWW